MFCAEHLLNVIVLHLFQSLELADARDALLDVCVETKILIRPRIFPGDQYNAFEDIS